MKEGLLTMLLLSEMRRKIKGVYGPIIRGQPVDSMADNQVYSIFCAMRERGKFNSDSKQINLSDIYPEFDKQKEKVG